MSVLKQIFQESLQDSTGRYSHARIISMLVAIAATVFMWKLIITSAVTIEFFVAYLAYGTGHQTINKFLDAFAIRGSNKKIEDIDPRMYNTPSRSVENTRYDTQYSRDRYPGREEYGTDRPVAKTPIDDEPPTRYR